MSKIETGPLRAQGDDLMRVAPPAPASELEDFVYIVSHDLRNSVRALGEVPQWLREDLTAQGVELSTDTREDFDLLDRHARRLDRMLLDLLVYSRVGRLQEISKVPFAHLMDRVVSESSVPDNVTVEYPQDLPEITMGYKDGFVLLKCIVDNVVQHCRRSGATLQMTAERNGDHVILDFKDNGPGVRLSDLPRMFRPMTTLRRRDEVEGSGMGLAIVHRIARHYGGDVYAGLVPESGGLHLRIVLYDVDQKPSERFHDLEFDADTPNTAL